ncbi:hypothetical protein K505DRAFT_17057 [Melanomma pulvis-pyrius CBS 109.77]|uniref:Uncharacterized protein n=1 Tax=Melanomma pulvis-pyrius CBS 109.77 TaxID=1314802 RepID=A0A6A6XV35_9PLEO|nr:hypothetical protein K505DRAFT_17057 [Melanomma pulvis-pyrius CBS 109.77]
MAPKTLRPTSSQPLSRDLPYPQAARGVIGLVAFRSAEMLVVPAVYGLVVASLESAHPKLGASIPNGDIFSPASYKLSRLELWRTWASLASTWCELGALLGLRNPAIRVQMPEGATVEATRGCCRGSQAAAGRTLAVLSCHFVDPGWQSDVATEGSAARILAASSEHCPQPAMK